jgi:hypothetical protein
VPGLAHGKMYKRYTFGSSCPSLGTRFGAVKQKTTNHEDADRKSEEENGGGKDERSRV